MVKHLLTKISLLLSHLSPQMPKDHSGTAMGTGGTKLRSFLKQIIDETKVRDDEK